MLFFFFHFLLVSVFSVFSQNSCTKTQMNCVLSYLYPCHNDSTIDPRAVHRSGSKAHIDYSVDPNAMGMHKQRKSIDLVRYTNGMTHGTFYMSVSLDRRTVNLNTPYINHHRAYNEQGTKYRTMDQLLFWEKERRKIRFFFPEKRTIFIDAE